MRTPPRRPSPTSRGLQACLLSTVLVPTSVLAVFAAPAVRAESTTHLAGSQSFVTTGSSGTPGPTAPAGWHVRTQRSPGWGWPLRSPEIIRAFDPPEHDWLAGHRGVDLAADPGTSVASSAAGRVTFAGVVADRGVVVVEHGAVRTTYEPVTAAVRPGTEVARGQLLGVVGTGGHCDHRCLHWGALRGDDYIDPALLVVGYRPVLKTPR